MISFTVSGILDHLPLELKSRNASDFYLVDEGYVTGQVAATTKTRKSYWDHWTTYFRPLGMDTYLQEAPYVDKVGQSRRIWTRTVGPDFKRLNGYYGHWTDNLSGLWVQPNKDSGIRKNDSPLTDGWQKMDPPTKEQLPVEADVPEYLAGLGGAI